MINISCLGLIIGLRMQQNITVKIAIFLSNHTKNIHNDLNICGENTIIINRGRNKYIEKDISLFYVSKYII